MDSGFSLTMHVGAPQMCFSVAHFACIAMTLNLYFITFYVYPYVNCLEDTKAKLLNTIFNCKTLSEN